MVKVFIVISRSVQVFDMMKDFKSYKAIGAKNDQKKGKQRIDELATGSLFSLVAFNLLTLHRIFPFRNVKRFALGLIL